MASLLSRVSDRMGAPFPGAVLATVAGAGIVVLLGPAVGSPAAAATAVAAFLAGGAAMLVALDPGHPHAAFGPGNAVTLIRLSLAALLLAAVPGFPQSGQAWALTAIASLGLVLDGVDGWLARRTGLTSRFGARFDMEVDCAFALVLSVLALQSHKVGAWVLALGLARYAFWAAALALPWLDGPLPERRSRKTVCVVQIAALIALVSPAVAAPVATPLAAGALALVAWSFAADVRHLWRARP
jgi:phosphatidylglycerophosphate synthase